MNKKTTQDITHTPSCIAVVGMSGAGRSTALNVLEDCGYHTVENIPPELVERLFKEPMAERKLALGFGAMSKTDHEKLEVALKYLSEQYAVEILFVEASDDVLMRRYSETRRKHFHTDGNRVLDGVNIERTLLAGTRSIATSRLDTSSLSPHDLKREIKHRFHLEKDAEFQVHIKSFSYKHGLPRDADMIFDCRFLKNPHWDDALRSLDGRNTQVASFVRADPLYEKFFNDMRSMIKHILPAVQTEGRSYFTICLGCSGGKHRSVAIAEAISEDIIKQGWHISIEHRELPLLTKAVG